MLTPITYITTLIPPTEMWVEGNTARDYKSQGFEIVEYEAPPPQWAGVWSGRARIRKTGGPTKHRYSPELVALHAEVMHALGTCGPPYGRGISPSRREFQEGHSKLFNEMQYHETLMHPQDGDTLGDVQARVVRALLQLSEEARYKPTKRGWEACAEHVQSWSYTKDEP